MSCWIIGTVLLVGAFGLAVLACVTACIAALGSPEKRQTYAGIFADKGLEDEAAGVQEPSKVSEDKQYWLSMERRESLAHVGGWVFLASIVLVLLCLVLLAWCFLSGDTSIRYVVYYRSDSASDLAWLFKLSGIWGGSEGSLLLWAFLVLLFGLPAAWRCGKCVRDRKVKDVTACEDAELTLRWGRVQLDVAALAVLALVAAAFLGFILFVEGNRVFDPLSAKYFDSNGDLTGQATLWGLSALLEHWAMAVHPPLLFVGYAGLTVPFAYAVAVLMTGNKTSAWAQRSRIPLLIAWIFLSLGIATGGAWAYSVLGWGGYWGWDAVENASLLPWLACVSLIHSFDALAYKGLFRRWTPFCACLTFSLVGLDAFITRSGVIGSVHAFAGNSASAVLFGAVTIIPLVIGGILVVARSKTPKVSNTQDESEASEEYGALSREVAFYFNNVFVFGLVFVIAYATLAPALPLWLPLGGQTMSAAGYNAIIAPYTAIYLCLLALCPLVKWATKRAKAANTQLVSVSANIASKDARNESQDKRCRRKKLCFVVVLGLVLFAPLLLYWLLELHSASLAVDAPDEFFAAAMVGPRWYVEVISLTVFLAAAFALSSAIFSCLSALRLLWSRQMRSAHTAVARIGAALSHAGMAVLAIGLVGSMLYTTQQTFEVPVNRHTAELTVDAKPIEIDGYRLDYEGIVNTVDANMTDLFSTTTFSVSHNGSFFGEASPSVQAVATTKQTHFHAAILSQPLEDLFVVFKGTAVSANTADTDTMQLILEVRVNRLIGFVWAGAVLFIAGAVVSAVCGLRQRKLKALQ